jgi:hypothetical protein
MAKSTRSRVSRTTARPLVVRPALPSGGRLRTAGLITTFAGNPERFNRGDLDKQNPNFGPNGERHDEHDRKPRYEVELMVRTFFGDTGARPTTDPNLVFWESPDIWIDGPSGDPDQATPGVTNIVNVHVWNTGLADCWAAHVDLYWCDPSVGVTPALAQPVGSTAVTLMGGEHKIVPFPWVPTLANGGHECLVAQVYDPVSDPLISPFSPTLDRHVCQRNISVVTVAPGQAFQFIVAVPNLSYWAAASALSAERLIGSSRRQFFRTIGTAEPPVLTRAGSVAVSPRLLSRGPVGEEAALRASGAFRESLDPEPSRSVRRRVAGALQALAAPRGRTDRMVRGRSLAAMTATPAVHDGEDADGGRTGLGERQLTLEAGSVTLVAIEGRLARESGSEGRDVYRVVERVEGRVTGGVTLLVKPLARRSAPVKSVTDSVPSTPRRGAPPKRRATVRAPRAR